MPRSYMVVGFYEDNKQPWCYEQTADTPRAAAKEAVKGTLEANGWIEDDAHNIQVVEVLDEERKGVLGSDLILSGSELLEDE